MSLGSVEIKESILDDVTEEVVTGSVLATILNCATEAQFT
jgi:hypothetical protein